NHPGSKLRQGFWMVFRLGVNNWGLTIKRFRHLFLHVVGKCVRTGRKQLLKLSSLYAYSELFSALYSRIRKVNLNLPVPYEPPRRKASLMMH
ncbi:hypothetical protein V2O63_07545, partial [Streptococcus pneumoniae]